MKFYSTVFDGLCTSGGSINFENGRESVSDPSSFIANAHNELHRGFYTGNGDLLENILS